MTALEHWMNIGYCDLMINICLMLNTIEFVVDSVSVERNIYHIAGVCNSNSIALGSTFLKVYKNLIGKDAKGFPVVEGKEFLRNIEVKVKRIRSYNRDLNELPQGMSGELWLEGKEGLKIQPKELLIGKN